MPHLSPEIRAWRRAHGLPPEPKEDLATFLDERLGPLAVPTGTMEPLPLIPVGEGRRVAEYLAPEFRGPIPGTRLPGPSLTDRLRIAPEGSFSLGAGRFAREVMRGVPGQIAADVAPIVKAADWATKLPILRNMRQSLVKDAQKAIELTGKVTEPIERAFAEFDRKQGVSEGTHLEALILAAPPGTMSVGGVSALGRELGSARRVATQAAQKAAPAARRLAAEEAGAIRLSSEERGARIKRFLDDGVQGRFVATNKAVEEVGLKMDALAGTRADEFFVAIEVPKGGRVLPFGRGTEPIPGVTPDIGIKIVDQGLSGRRLFFKSFDDVDEFLKTGKYSAPSITSPLRAQPAKPTFVTEKPAQPSVGAREAPEGRFFDQLSEEQKQSLLREIGTDPKDMKALTTDRRGFQKPSEFTMSFSGMPMEIRQRLARFAFGKPAPRQVQIAAAQAELPMAEAVAKPVAAAKELKPRIHFTPTNMYELPAAQNNIRYRDWLMGVNNAGVRLTGVEPVKDMKFANRFQAWYKAGVDPVEAVRKWQGVPSKSLAPSVAPEALGPAAKPAQATDVISGGDAMEAISKAKGRTPKAPVGARRTPQQVPESVQQMAAESRAAPTGAPSAAGQVPPSPAPAAPPIKPPARTPTEATARVKSIQQKGQRTPDAVSSEEAKQAHVEMGAPDGPQPPKPPRPAAKGTPPPPDDPAGIVRQIAAKATQGERPDQTLLRLHEAAITNEARRNGIIVRDGNAKLKTLGIGVTRRGQLIPRTEDVPKLDELYNALHNPTKVASGEMQVPEGYEAIYAELRRLTDWEQAARLDFDPAMATVDDYFYRGWKPPEGAFAGVSQGRPLVKTPAFKKPRVDATYQEMREAGFEPLFWNPYQQWGLSRMQGTKYREQMELVDYLKGMGDDFARPHAGGPIPDGWRVPEVGPAFEGKPFATLDAAGEPTTMFTRRWIVPDRVANTLENIYGKRPDLGKLTVGTKTIDPLAVIDFLTFVPKRAKLIGSAFQQVDFLERAGAGSWTRFVDALFAGQPIEAVKALAKYPATAVTIIRSNFSPGLRQSLAKQLDSTAPLIKGRPGVNLKGVSEAGLSTFDPAMFRWEEMDKVVREVAQETGILGKARGAARAVGDLESTMRRGLFEGVYPAAMITDIQNNIAPMVARMYPKLNDAQLNGTIARIINKKYSSIPASQSVLQNRVMRETLRRVFFSIGESEGLLRQAASVVGGPNKKFWVKHWLGTYLFVIATAAAIHFASTGKPLPKERFTPVSKDKWGPLPFGYNTRFASPTIPLKGRGGAELTLDVVGQMDTALRILNPGQFITARESVLIRAMVNQASGTDFFGNRIDDVGPGGVISRTAQLIQDMFSPIGAGGLASEAARRNIPGAEQVIQEGESRLGMTGLGIQATGLNLRAATREQRLRSTLGPTAITTLKALDKLGVDLGYVTRNFDTQLGVKGGEVTLTSEQREQLQWLTDDIVVAGVALKLAETNFKKSSKEEQIDAIKSEITKLRAEARSQFRKQLSGSAPAPRSQPTLTPARRPLRRVKRTPTPEPVGAR